MELLVGIVFVDNAFELVPYGLVLFTGDRTNALPEFQKLVECIGGVVPRLGGLRELLGEFGGFVNQGLFGKEILVQFLFPLVIVFVAAFINLVCGIVEALPCLFVLFGGDWSYFAPLGTEFLQRLEGDVSTMSSSARSHNWIFCSRLRLRSSILSSLFIFTLLKNCSIRKW